MILSAILFPIKSPEASAFFWTTRLEGVFAKAPEKLAIPYDMLSDYCKKFADEYEIKVGDEKINSKFG